MGDSRVAVVVDNDSDHRNLVSTLLTQSGFQVHAAVNGMAGVHAVRNNEPSIVTLNIGLPDIDGFEVLRRVRGFSDAYIVMLSARGDEMDVVAGFQAGADDYVIKPFRPRELRARVEAMLRRPRRYGSDQPAMQNGTAKQAGRSPAASDGESLEHRGLVLNDRTRSVSIGELDLKLTRTEFDLLLALLQSGRTVRTKVDLVRTLRADGYSSYISEADERAVEVHMGNLRRKLGEDSKAPRWVETVRGVGYRLTP